MNIAELVKEYREIRDGLDRARKVFKDHEKEAKDQLAVLETQMLVISSDTGVDSFKTEYGTAFKTTKTYARLGAGEESKEARFKYAVDNNDYGLFTSHVNKTHALELVDAGVNMAEIGIEVVTENVIQFRK